MAPTLTIKFDLEEVLRGRSSSKLQRCLFVSPQVCDVPYSLGLALKYQNIIKQTHNKCKTTLRNIDQEMQNKRIKQANTQLVKKISKAQHLQKEAAQKANTTQNMFNKKQTTSKQNTQKLHIHNQNLPPFFCLLFAMFVRCVCDVFAFFGRCFCVVFVIVLDFAQGKMHKQMQTKMQKTTQKDAKGT